MQKTVAILLIVGIVIGAVVGFGGGVTIMTMNQLQSELSDARNQLSTTQSELSDARNQLSTTQSELSDARNQLSTTQSELSNTTSDLVQVRSELSGKQFELDTEKAELSKAQIAVTKSNNLLNIDAKITHLNNQVTYNEAKVADSIVLSLSELPKGLSEAKSLLKEVPSLVNDSIILTEQAIPLADQLSFEAPDHQQQDIYANSGKIMRAHLKQLLSTNEVFTGLGDLIEVMEMMNGTSGQPQMMIGKLNDSLDSFNRAQTFLNEAIEIEPRLTMTATQAQLTQLITIVQNLRSELLASSKTLSFSLREHATSRDFNPEFSFSSENSRIKMTSTASSIGNGYIYVVVPRTWINDKYLRWSWQGYASYPTRSFQVWIYDGEYIRSNDNDFPTGQSIVTKGNGLLQTLAIKTGPFAEEVQDIRINVSGGNQQKVTIFFTLIDNWNAQDFWMSIDWFEINEGAGGAGNIYREHFTDSVHMERVGTTGDYGYISKGVTDNLPTSNPSYQDFPNRNVYANLEIKKFGCGFCYGLWDWVLSDPVHICSQRYVCIK